MLCCLKTLWSISRISFMLTERASIKLTTIRTCSTIGWDPLAESFFGVEVTDRTGRGRSAATLEALRWLRSHFFFLPCGSR